MLSSENGQYALELFHSDHKLLYLLDVLQWLVVPASHDSAVSIMLSWSSVDEIPFSETGFPPESRISA